MRVTFSKNDLTAGRTLVFAGAVAFGSCPVSARAEPPVVELTVPGERLRHEKDAPGTATTVVPREELQQPGQSSADVLRTVPGVQVARSGASSDFATASLRGATSEQTPIYLGGVRLNDDVGGIADLSATPLWILDRIAIYRGNAPDYVDRLGIGGALVLHPRLPQQSEVRLGGSVGSYDERGQWIAGSVSGDRSAALVGLKLSSASNDYRFLDDQGTLFDDQDDRLTRRMNADFGAVDFWAISRHRLNHGLRVSTVFNAFQREQGINGLSISPALHARVTQRRLLAGVTVDMKCGAHCEASSTTQALLGRSVTEDPRREISALLTERLDVSGERASQRLALAYKVEALQLSPSVWFSYEETRVMREQSASLSAQRMSLRPAFAAEMLLGPTRAYGLIALECHHTGSQIEGVELPKVQADLCEEAEPVGRLGVEATVSEGTQVLVSAGKYTRIPTVGERFGTSPVVRGNDALKVERSLGVDAGVRTEQSWPALSLGFDLTAFARATDDLIGFRQTSLGIVRPFNVASARNLGLETALDADLFDHFRLCASATLLDPRDTSPGRREPIDQLPYRSRLVSTVATELHSAIPKLGIQRGTLGLEYFRRASRFVDGAGLVVLPAEESLDLTSSATFASDTLNLFFAIRNLTDESYIDLLGAPLPGRTVHVALEATIVP